MRCAGARGPAFALLWGLLLGAPDLAAESTAIDPAAFGPFEGCALIVTRDRHDQVDLTYRPDLCRVPRSPCSTFKIPNALIGLQTGVISGPGHAMTWDGKVRERAVANRDHDLASAIRHSVPWYFQALAREVGPERMQRWIDRLDYGNRDLSGGIDQFWLSSSLTIDAHGQMELIRALWRSALPFDPDVQAEVRGMLRQDAGLDGELFGKTGSCRGRAETSTPDHGWFVGWVDWEAKRSSNPATTWFVVQIIGDEAWGWQAREIALALLQNQAP